MLSTPIRNQQAMICIQIPTPSKLLTLLMVPGCVPHFSHRLTLFHCLLYGDLKVYFFSQCSIQVSKFHMRLWQELSGSFYFVAK